jgi:hypothetical protein
MPGQHTLSKPIVYLGVRVRAMWGGRSRSVVRRTPYLQEQPAVQEQQQGGSATPTALRLAVVRELKPSLRINSPFVLQN